MAVAEQSIRLTPVPQVHPAQAIEPVFMLQALAWPHHVAPELRVRFLENWPDVDKHHRHGTHFGGAARARCQQPLDHLRRDMLAEQVGDAVARRACANTCLELPPQLLGLEHQPG